MAQAINLSNNASIKVILREISYAGFFFLISAICFVDQFVIYKPGKTLIPIREIRKFEEKKNIAGHPAEYVCIRKKNFY